MRNNKVDTCSTFVEGGRIMTASSNTNSFFGTGIPENCTKQERLMYGTPGAGKAFALKKQISPILNEDICREYKRQAVFGFESPFEIITNYLFSGNMAYMEGIMYSIGWSVCSPKR